MRRDRTILTNARDQSDSSSEFTAMLSETARGCRGEREPDEDARTGRATRVFREAALLLATLVFLAAAAIATRGASIVLVWIAGPVVLQVLVLVNVAKDGVFERLVKLAEGVLLSVMGSVYLLAYSWRIWQGPIALSEVIPPLMIAGLVLVAGLCRLSARGGSNRKS